MRAIGRSKRSPPPEGEDWTVPGVGMEFVWVAALNCWVGKYEVTNGEFRTFEPEHDSKAVYANHSLNGARQPAGGVSYDDAVSFAEWLTRRERQAGRLPEGFRYRLPDGDEWTTFAQCGDGRKKESAAGTKRPIGVLG